MYRALYLAIVYEFGSYKNRLWPYQQVMWVQVQVQDAAAGRQLQRTADCATHNLKR